MFCSTLDTGWLTKAKTSWCPSMAGKMVGYCLAHALSSHAPAVAAFAVVAAALFSARRVTLFLADFICVRSTLNLRVVGRLSGQPVLFELRHCAGVPRCMPEPVHVPDGGSSRSGVAWTEVRDVAWRLHTQPCMQSGS